MNEMFRIRTMIVSNIHNNNSHILVRLLKNSFPFHINNSTIARFHEQGIQQETSHNEDQQCDTKILKAAIVGVPNAGKSTLINKLVGRNVFSMSCKVHTTRHKASAVMIDDKTQVVFVDTPGIVSVSESTKHHLEHTFLLDGEDAIKEADVIGLIHDASNRYTRHKLDPKVLRLLYLFPKKPSFLILNKVDVVRSKSVLLECARLLTGNSRSDRERLCNNSELRGSRDDLDRLTEIDIRDRVNKDNGWPYFNNIFMISALDGDGVDELKTYLVDQAKPGKWLFHESEFTDQEPTKLVEDIVRAKLLDYLPDEIPYNVKVQIEYFNQGRDDSVTAVVLLKCEKPRIQRLIKGPGGQKIRSIALDVEQDMRHLFLSDVRLRLVIADKYGRAVITKDDNHNNNNNA